MLGAKIKSSRLLKGFTLEELAAKTGNITKQAISKYESGKSIPGKDVLLRIASALDVKISFFFSETSINITYGAYRKKSSLSKSDDEIIKAKIEKELEKRTWLDSIINPEKNPFFHDFNNKNINDIEDFAVTIRKNWNLGLDPVENVVNAVEDRGIYVIEIETNNKFDAINGVVNNDTGFIVINKNIPRCRQRFDTLHELFHLITGLSEDKENELMAHRFASAFLVPNEIGMKELGNNRVNLNFNELKLLKLKYGLSIQAWIRRAFDLGIINKSVYQRLFIRINQLGWRKSEPLDDLPKEEPTKFKLLVMRAVMENIISVFKAEELMPDIKKELIESYEVPQDKVKPQDIMKMPFIERKKYLETLNWNEVEKDYKEDPKLKEFSDAVGDDEL